MRPSLVLVPFVFLLIACGGNVVIDDSSIGGNGSASTSTTSSGACAKGMCPMFPPTAGEPCPCFGEACPYDQCPEDGSLTTATCTAGTWALQTESCAGTPPCGMLQCTPGFVCLHHIGGPVTSTPEQCVQDPCGASPLSCSCATNVCPTGDGYTCSVMDGDLVCGCPLCK
jgi:hypothetical protein